MLSQNDEAPYFELFQTPMMWDITPTSVRFVEFWQPSTSGDVAKQLRHPQLRRSRMMMTIRFIAPGVDSVHIRITMMLPIYKKSLYSRSDVLVSSLTLIDKKSHELCRFKLAQVSHRKSLKKQIQAIGTYVALVWAQPTPHTNFAVR